MIRRFEKSENLIQKHQPEIPLNQLINRVKIHERSKNINKKIMYHIRLTFIYMFYLFLFYFILRFYLIYSRFLYLYHKIRVNVFTFLKLYMIFACFHVNVYYFLIFECIFDWFLGFIYDVFKYFNILYTFLCVLL